MRLLIFTALFFMLVVFLAPAAGAQKGEACAGCGEIISGENVEIDGRYYHAKCFRCDHCGKPIPDAFTRYEGKNYHTPCFESFIAIRCGVCGEVITGKYLSDFWGGAYHPEHVGRVVQCGFCRRFITGDLAAGAVKFQDGRHLCGLCSPAAVFEAGEAKSLMARVAKQLRGFGLSVDAGPIEVSLVGRETLRRLASGASKDPRGFVNFEVTTDMSGDVKHRTVRMYLLYGMPRTGMIGAIAHELTHVWLHHQGVGDQDRALVEGSCNYAAYLVLRKAGTKPAEFIIDNMENNPDAAYGEGFRRIKRYAELNGLDGWRNLVKDQPQRASF